MIKRLSFLILFLAICGIFEAQNTFGPAALQEKLKQCNLIEHEACSSDFSCAKGLIGTGKDAFTKVDPPEWFSPSSDRVSNIVVTYGPGFPVQAQTALEYSLNIWGQLLNSQITIWVDATWGNLPGGVLAQAGPETVHQNFTGAPFSNRYYAAALANSISISDLTPGVPDINITFGSSFNWYYGLDGNTPSSFYDFVTVALHEVGHGLGFIGSATHNGTSGFIGLGGIPMVYDTFVETIDGTGILTFNSGTVSLGNALESDGLYWNGAGGIAASTIGRPRLYAPSVWNSGSSFSHLRENTYAAGDVNSLMTPFLGTAEAIHDPGPVVQGIYADMGWNTNVAVCSVLSASSGLQLPCNPATSTYTQQVIITYENNPTLGLLMVNGTSHVITSSPQTVTLINQPADGLPVDLEVYFTNNPTCITTFPAAYTAIPGCCADLRLVDVNPDTKTISIVNSGTCGDVLNGFKLFSNFLEIDLGVLIPGTVVAPGEVVQVVWTGWTPSFIYVNEGELALVNPIGQVIDYVQWGSPNHSAELNAVANNLWLGSNYIHGEPPYVYSGSGLFGLNEWSYLPYQCSVLAVNTGVTSPCGMPGNSYSQNLEVVLLAPPTTGIVSLNGQVFPLSPVDPLLWDGVVALSLILDNLNSDALPVNLNVSFSDNLTCSASYNALFTAPAGCFCINNVNNNASVDVGDLLDVLSEFGCLTGCLFDVTSDGAVNISDLLSVLSSFGVLCP